MTYETQMWTVILNTNSGCPGLSLRWLGIKHQRIEPQCPWMNGRIERVWSTFKQLLRAFDIRNEAELQAMLDLLRDTYNQHRPHQSLSGRTPVEAWNILQKRKAKPKRPRRR
jgi:putative transposase